MVFHHIQLSQQFPRHIHRYQNIPCINIKYQRIDDKKILLVSFPHKLYIWSYLSAWRVLIGNSENEFSKLRISSGAKQNTTDLTITLETSKDIEVCNTVEISEQQAEPWTVLAHKKPQKEWIPYNPKTMRPPPLAHDIKHVKLMSWNVNGLRALLKLESFMLCHLLSLL